MPIKSFIRITLELKEVLEKMEMLQILQRRKDSKNSCGNSMKKGTTLATSTVIICDGTMR